MSARHTRGKIDALADCGLVSEESGYLVGATIQSGRFSGSRDYENARRLAACWNAFDGIPTDDIELMAESDSLKLAPNKMHNERAELLAALQKLVQQVESGYFDHIATNHPNSAVIAARAAITKATGVQP
jgi:hypothetical protein